MANDRPAGAKRCIGVDVGGTFTDAILSDGSLVWRAKAPSTPGNLGAGVLAACRLVAEQAGTSLEAVLPMVSRFGLGTTAVTNTIASRTGRRLGLITTAGFEDLVPMARAMRANVDGWLVEPESLVDRERIRGVSERIDRSGTVVTALDRQAVTEAARWLVENQGIEALTVSFLWSCANDHHERQAVELVRELYPSLPITAGADLLPVIREFERTQFALLNAYVSGALDGVDSLTDELARLGLPAPPLLVHSGGGSISASEGHHIPATLAESGPAAGVVAAMALCEVTGISDAVTGDVGGTSFDVSFISGGQPTRRSSGELMGLWTALPMIDIDSVGTGGGSVGWIDALNILRVGPHSAGAEPGPACYGQGGTQPTVTDALVVLGYIDPDRFLGGTMALDKAAARDVCSALGSRLGIGPVEAAWGVWEVAKATMVRALRARFTERGVDHRSFWLISMGGCGALSSAAIAGELGLRGALVPELASVLSAFGAATSDVRRERSRSVSAIVPASSKMLTETAEHLMAEVRRDLASDGIPAGEMTLGLSADLRFHRQKYELQIPWEGGFDEAAQQELRQRFTAEYQARYGKGAMVSGAPVEIVTLRAFGLGSTVRATLADYGQGEQNEAPSSRTRPVHVTRDGATVDVPVVDGGDLRPGHVLAGPAIVDADDTTIWIPAGFTGRVDRYRSLHLEASS
jgi:N-methylhydantoinase A